MPLRGVSKKFFTMVEIFYTKQTRFCACSNFVAAKVLSVVMVCLWQIPRSVLGVGLLVAIGFIKEESYALATPLGHAHALAPPLVPGGGRDDRKGGLTGRFFLVMPLVFSEIEFIATVVTIQYACLSHNLRSMSAGTQCRKSQECTNAISIFVSPLLFNNMLCDKKNLTFVLIT